MTHVCVCELKTIPTIIPLLNRVVIHIVILYYYKVQRSGF